MKTTHTLRRILSVRRERDLFGATGWLNVRAPAKTPWSVAVVLAGTALCMLTGFALGRRH